MRVRKFLAKGYILSNSMAATEMKQMKILNSVLLKELTESKDRIEKLEEENQMLKLEQTRIKDEKMKLIEEIDTFKRLQSSEERKTFSVAEKDMDNAMFNQQLIHQGPNQFAFGSSDPQFVKKSTNVMWNYKFEK